MGREIKFRAKRIDNGEWFYGGCYQVMSIHFIKNGIGQYCEVAPKTVSQFTGLNDKNEKEIYEGDIIKSSYLKIVGTYGKAINIDASGIVEFHDAQFCIYVGTTKAGVKRYKYFNQLWPLSPSSYECEITGNIHDNLELINQQ